MRFRPEPDPYLVAAILVSGSQRRVAQAMGVPLSTLNAWTRRPTIPTKWLSKMMDVSAALIEERKHQLSKMIADNPAIIFRKDFVNAVDDLDTAHQLRHRCRLVGGKGADV